MKFIKLIKKIKSERRKKIKKVLARKEGMNERTNERTKGKINNLQLKKSNLEISEEKKAKEMEGRQEMKEIWNETYGRK